MSGTMSEIKFEPIGVASVLKRDKSLRVPVNQREYSWTDDEVDELFRDLADAMADGKTTYFLGTIVLNVGGETPKSLTVSNDLRPR